MSQSSGDEAAETDEMMPDAGIRDVAAAITSADTLPFFMEEIKGSDFDKLIKRRGQKIRGIILGGGSPCQGNSSLNARRKGLDDPQSHQPYHLQRLEQEL